MLRLSILHLFVSLPAIAQTPWPVLPTDTPDVTSTPIASASPEVTNQALSTPTPLEPTVTAAPSPTVPWADDIAYLGFNLLETGYGLNPRLSTKIQLITSGETVINNNCIKGVSPKYLPSYNNPDSPCIPFINKLIALDPANPSAICALKGIESQECTQAYAQIDLALIDSYREAVDQKDIDAFMEQTEPSNSIALDNKIIALTRAAKDRHDDKAKEELRTLLKDNLPTTCRVVRYYISPNPQPLSTPTVEQTPSASFADVLKQLNAPNQPKTAQKTERATRFRLVSGNCLNLLNSFKEFDPSSYMYVCMKEGGFSPNCLKAKKLAQAQNKLKDGTLLPQADGIQPF